MNERREGLESINNDITAAAFATDMAELESPHLKLTISFVRERMYDDH